MTTKIQKWGNSLAIRIPKAFAAEADLSELSTVDLSIIDGKLVLTPFIVPAYTLEELVGGITDDNLHEAFWTGPPVGREEW